MNTYSTHILINENLLIDMGFNGNKFTWKRGRVLNTYIAKRLDRVLCCAQARLKWQEARVTHLPFLSSDHAPLYIQLIPEGRSDPKRRPFRFEAAWLSHSGFKELIQSSWKRELTTPEALRMLQRTLRRWNKEVFGDIQTRKEKLMTELTTLQNLLETNQTDELLEKEAVLLKEFETVLEQEEMLWFQKSRERWVALGDRNTSFFHTSTVIRRRRNRIELLKNDEGRWISDKNELEQLAVEYYKRLYSLADVESVVDSLSREGFERLTHDEIRELNRPFLAAEVEMAVKKMGKFKAPGPDGFQPVFYQDCWDVVGDSVVKFDQRSNKNLE